MSHPRSRAHAFQHGDDERTAQTEPTAAVVCPACGHMLSMFTEPAVTLPERIASQMAAFFGSWRFLVLLVVSATTWVTVNVAWQPFEPHPAMMLTYLGLGLTLLASVQLPLIPVSYTHLDVYKRQEQNRAFVAAAEGNQVNLTVDYRPGAHEWSYWDATIQDVLAWLPLRNRP